MDLLIKKPITQGSTVSFRLTSGEEIVATLDNDDGTTFTVSKPIHVISQMTPQGIGIIFAPFMTTVDDGGKFTFKHSHVATPLMLTKEEVKSSYIEATSSIVPAKAAPPGLIR